MASPCDLQQSQLQDCYNLSEIKYYLISIHPLAESSNLDKIKENASSIVNHSESTIERQRKAVFPVHFAGGS